MGSRWLTFVFIVSLGPMAWLCGASGTLALAADEESANSVLGNTDERRRALELLQRATVELQANRLDEARRLAKQAADLNAAFSLFDLRPEHVLAEIERRERAGGGSPRAAGAGSDRQTVQARKPASGLVGAAAESPDPPDPFEQSKAGEAPQVGLAAASASRMVPIAQAAVGQAAPAMPAAGSMSPDQLKARAIEILDRGLQALDDQRLDDAERSARAAQSLHAPFSKLEYKPEYLITEIGIARARLRLDAAASRSTLPASSPATSSSAMTQPQLHAVAPAESPRDASLTESRALSQAAFSPAPTAVSAPATTASHAYPTPQSAASVQGATSSRERAERLLQAALSDLRAGHDDVARSRIEVALGVIHPGMSRPLPLLFPADSSTVAAPPSQTGPPRPAMPRAGFPTYVPDRAAETQDVVLKPLHDPYLGDDATTTQKSTAGENSLRESMPQYAPLNPGFTLNRPLPVMTDEFGRPAGSPNPASSTPGAATVTAGVETQSQTAKDKWPESDIASPSPPTAAPAPSWQSAAPASSAQTPPEVSLQATPSVQPAPGTTPPSRFVYAPVTSDSWQKSKTDENQGFFDKIWHALTGE